MRLHYGTLNRLPRGTFAEEARLAANIERQSSGILRRSAASMGMAGHFAKWEACASPLATMPSPCRGRSSIWPQMMTGATFCPESSLCSPPTTNARRLKHF